MIFINGWHFVINWFVAFLSLGFICFILAVILKKPLLKSISLCLFSVFLVLAVVEKYFLVTGANYPQKLQNEILKNKYLLEKLCADFVPECNQVTVGVNKVILLKEGIVSNHFLCRTHDFVLPEGATVMYSMEYSTNSWGFRLMPQIDSDNAYIFLGCSFVFGVGVNDIETLSYYFLEEMGRRNAVYNFGIKGKSINAALSVINNNLIDVTVSGKNVEHVFFLMIHDTFYRPFRFASASDAAIFNDGKIFYQKQPLGFFKMLMSSSALYNRFVAPVINTRSRNFYYATVLGKIKAMQELVQDKYGAKFTVILWYFNPSVKSFFEKNNIDFVFVENAFKQLCRGWSNPYTKHPFPQAHQAVARALFEHIYGDRNY